MKVILATRNRYLEYGLQQLLKKHSVILAREFFMPENRWYTPEYNESWLVICDGQLRRLMRSLFQGRHFLQLDVDMVRGIEDVHDAVRNNLWLWNTGARALTMSEMVVIFGYIYRQLRPCRLASEMGINPKTVNTFLYTALAKNDLDGSRVRLLAIADKPYKSVSGDSSGAVEIRQ
ncbi:hypothetical protein [Escherichia coli]|uniref:hypothetical protein n=1 Tax=Escherichia coli TaxID=562 RepID=UPI000BE9060A|nr:hypothetical protein [Escherichia coli]EFA3707879.1 hypothetical protein [Escherichia coli]EFC5425664.1 hypothetical protein [Escherichia coli]EHS3230645.1 hypothetical protein [Escherichia coli]EHS3240398.1 hypothetical protein [Escherichia coli]EHS3304328.1 hypothetical protein [Escherichia coli]